MTDSTVRDAYAVVGNPIDHSLSPAIHQRFALQTGEAVEYDRLEAPLDDFAGTVVGFFRDGGAGLNVTVPFKQEAWAMVTRRSPRAESAGAVNTLIPEGTNGALYGDNTDGVGMVRDLQDNHQVELSNARVLVLGAGGAVRGVLGPLLETGPAAVVIANRTLEKAQSLCELFAGGTVLEARRFEAAEGPFDLIINGTSASLQGALPPLPDSAVGPETVCYDMMYGKGTTVFNQWGLDRGAARALDGLGMLVEQAAEAFWLWRGVRPDTGPVIEALRRS